MTRTVVFTAIMGDYNVLQPAPSIPGVDFVAFLDEPSLRTDWDIRVVERISDVSPRRWAKRYKMRPDVYLPEFDHTIWVDGTVRIDSSTFAAEAMACAEPSGIAMFTHPERDCIFDEAVVSLTMPKYQAEPIVKQVNSYRRQGMEHHSGLWACGIIARQNTEQIRELGEMWLAEVDRWSVQDQISLPPCLRALDIVPGAFPGNLYSNSWLSVMGHDPTR
jgi:hypothetical protein